MPILAKKKRDDAKPSDDAPEKSEPQSSIPTAAKPTTLKQRRRPTLIALGVALIAVCALGAWWLVDRMSTTTEVVAASQDVPPGTILTEEDLTTVSVHLPESTSVVPASELESLIGQRTTGAVDDGSLISPGQVADNPFPSEGSAVVGLRVKAGQIPLRDVDPGDAVEVIGTPREGDDPPNGEAPVVTGRIQAIGSPMSDGSVIVDVLVSEDQAATLAALGATGRISVILSPEEE